MSSSSSSSLGDEQTLGTYETDYSGVSDTETTDDFEVDTKDPIEMAGSMWRMDTVLGEGTYGKVFKGRKENLEAAHTDQKEIPMEIAIKVHTYCGFNFKNR